MNKDIQNALGSVESTRKDTWMDGVGVITDTLPGSKGIVVSMQPPEIVETRFGTRKTTLVEIKGADDSIIQCKMFLPQQFPMIHPKSSLAKIMQHYGCKQLKELIGKEVDVERVGDMLWKIKVE